MKLVFKLLVLVFIFLIVVMFRQYTGSKTFKESVGMLFGVGGPSNTTNWCVENTADILWTTTEVSENMKQQDVPYLRSHICELTTEPIAGVDIDKVSWAPLAESHGPAGQLSKLEWNKELSLFRAGGMPFKSSKFAKDLQN